MSVPSSQVTCESLKSEGRIQSRLATGVSIFTLGIAANKLLLLAIQVLLARLLRISGYGLYNLGFNAVILLQWLALMGLGRGVLRYGAVHRARRGSESIKGLLLASLVLGFASSLVVAAALF